MAHSNEGSEAVDVPAAGLTDADALAALEDIFPDGDGEDGGDDDQGDGPDGNAADDGNDASDDQDDGDEDGQDGDEPEGAIEAPVSLNADEKAVFAQLPPEAQRAWSASEARRNGQVQEATTKAANAQRVAEQQAASAQAEAQAVYAEQLAQFVSNFAPTPPDANLARHNPAEYIAQKAQFDAANAEFQQLVQQVHGIGGAANQAIDQAFIQSRDRELLAIPEVANAETRDGYLGRAFEAAQALGLNPNDVAANAAASEIKALAQASDWKAKAEKYDALMAKNMQRVRDAKTAKSGSVKPKQGDAERASKAMQRLRQTGSERDAVAALAAIGE